MRKYKVLQITNFMDMSGQQETVLSTTAGLNTDYFEAHLAANLSGSTRRNVDTILARRARSIPHLHVHDLPYVRIMPSPYHDTRTLIDLVRLMRRERFDIVQTQATKIALIGRIAAKIARVPIIVHFSHGWPYEFTLIPKPARTGFLMMEKVAAKMTDQFITCDYALLESGIRHNLGTRDQFVVIRSGMDLDRFLTVNQNQSALRQSLGIPPGVPVVGTVMIFEAKKKPELIVEIAPRLLEAAPDTHFLLVGDGEMMNPIKTRIAELGLQDRFILTGLREDVPELMAIMDIFVHPAWFDVLPRAIVQALATGTPVVATRVGGIPEVITDGENGFLVTPRDLDALASPVIQLLQDPQLRATMGRNARESSSAAFTVDAMIKATEDLYMTLIEKKFQDNGKRYESTESA